MEMTATRMAAPVLLFLVLVCSVDAMNYLAFPRMGRSGYLAFPRMGRSQAKAETAADIASCCGLGLKSEFLVASDGKEELHSACAEGSMCCPGLREIVDEKPNGVFYSMCIPEMSSEQGGPTSQVLSKLKSLLQK